MQVKLRQHQFQTDQAFQGIIDKKPKFINIRTLLLSVVAGGGKGSVVVNAGKLLKAGLVDRIAGIVPRKSLQTQCEEVCMDPFFQKLFGVKISLRASTNDMNPCRGMNGFVTTYQALGCDKREYVLQEIKSKRYCVILDEFHHVELDSPWHAAVKKIIEAAEFVVLMSGTLSRANKKQIACVKYKNGYVDLSGDDKTYVITYPRSVALREKAILPLEFHLHDGSFSWEEKKGLGYIKKSADSFAEVQAGDNSKALYTALKTEFAEQLSDSALFHWLEYRKNNNRAKILFVCARIDDARRCLAYLKAMDIPALLATSHENKACTENIAQFKRHAPVLVTIAVAYEGLDVPPVSHVCVLTRIRSHEWLEQCVSRATRWDKVAGPYRDQSAHIFAPEDQDFLDFVKTIEKEQSTKAKPLNKKEEQLELFQIDEAGPGGGMEQGPCVPISSQISDLARSVLGIEKTQFERVVLTPKQEETDIRRDIDRYLKKYARDQGYEVPHVNREAKKINGKPRKNMTLYELKKFFGDIQRHFPLKDTGTFIPISRCQPIFTDVGQQEFDIDNERFF